MIEFENATFKDFENISKLNIDESSKIFEKYLSYKKYDDHQSYRIISKSGCSSKMILESKYGQEFISFK
ncbi:hypothetical protein [Sphingobacterium sp. UDSM-2020]|uniref:hypothetical protein n=1 Tax=Sphingobacterium sp. UDSM-2020 TaxID=2795738 RepID=UPI00193583BA|nr:hypothetical protein [Sphingobacterium sp. UDSM-2020]QQD13152.1 hypothetical protein JAZ75_21560 [Sphingobacterium sp. UDSM-2020]